jgi:Post-segregation antitoxin CcdA
MVTEEKQKLTLGLSKEVIDKAKALDLNISSVTEQLLTAMTYEPKGNTKGDVVKAYESLFGASKPLLKKYGASVSVGKETRLREKSDQTSSYIRPSLLGGSLFDMFNPPRRTSYSEQIDIMLDEGGLYRFSESDKSSERTTLERELHLIFTPLIILKNLIEALVKAAENNSRQMDEFRMALRIINSFSNNEPNAEKKQQQSSDRQEIVDPYANTP